MKFSLEIITIHLLPVVVSQHNQMISEVMMIELEPLVRRTVLLVHSRQQGEVGIAKI